MTGELGGVVLAAVTAFLLGLRHATDPDHLAAVSTLVLDREGRGGRETGLLGLAWGLGHAVTLLAFGLPVVLLGHRLPDAVHLGAEVAVGALIVVLALRLLLRWTRGRFHAHRHVHGELVHTHPHFHEGDGEHRHGHAVPDHRHRHDEALGRSPAATFGVGLVHGVGGSAGAVVLVLAAAGDPRIAAVALVAFAGAAALAMAVVSAAVGYALTRRSAGDGFRRVVPLVGVTSLAFGAWYVVEAFRALGP